MDQQETKKEKIVLCMIVRNEEDIILRALRSVENIVDYYCICDTGSTDKTVEVIQLYLKERRFKGEVHETPWVNFAHNRQIAFDRGMSKGDYIMTLDADEVFAPLDTSGPNLFRNGNLSSFPECGPSRCSHSYGKHGISESPVL